MYVLLRCSWGLVAVAVKHPSVGLPIHVLRHPGVHPPVEMPNGEQHGRWCMCVCLCMCVCVFVIVYVCWCVCVCACVCYLVARAVSFNHSHVLITKIESSCKDCSSQFLHWTSGDNSKCVIIEYVCVCVCAKTIAKSKPEVGGRHVLAHALSCEACHTHDGLSLLQLALHLYKPFLFWSILLHEAYTWAQGAAMGSRMLVLPSCNLPCACARHTVQAYWTSHALEQATARIV